MCKVWTNCYYNIPMHAWMTGYMIRVCLLESSQTGVDSMIEEGDVCTRNAVSYSIPRVSVALHTAQLCCRCGVFYCKIESIPANTLWSSQTGSTMVNLVKVPTAPQMQQTSANVHTVAGSLDDIGQVQSAWCPNPHHQHHCIPVSARNTVVECSKHSSTSCCCRQHMWLSPWIFSDWCNVPLAPFKLLKKAILKVNEIMKWKL